MDLKKIHQGIRAKFCLLIYMHPLNPRGVTHPPVRKGFGPMKRYNCPQTSDHILVALGHETELREPSNIKGSAQKKDLKQKVINAFRICYVTTEKKMILSSS